MCFLLNEQITALLECEAKHATVIRQFRFKCREKIIKCFNSLWRALTVTEIKNSRGQRDKYQGEESD